MESLMAYNGAEQPSESGLIVPTIQTNRRKVTERIICNCYKTAPSPDSVSGIGSHLCPKSNFAKLRSSLRQVAMLLPVLVYLGVGTICFYLARHQIKGNKTNGVLDAVYFCVVTMTTVGYGDLVPNSVLTKLLACALVFSGMALVGLTLSKAADYLAEKQGKLLAQALQMAQNGAPAEILKEVEANRVKLKCVVVLVLLLALIIVGTIFLTLVEEMNLVDAFYCVCSTIATLGYGDKSFSTQPGRVFSVFWIPTSTICLALFLVYIAELRAESRQKSLVRWVLNRKFTHKDLEAADRDHNGTVSEAEFIIYKLKEMGKISQDDISLVMDKFRKDDVDKTGTLSVSDIMPAQSSETVN